MRKIVTAVAAIALAAPAPLVLPAPAAAHAYNNIPDICKGIVASGVEPGLQRGECISLLTVQFHYYVDDGRGGRSFAQHACNYYEEAAPDYFYANWDTKQECMDGLLAE